MRKILFFLLGVLILRGDVLKDYLNQNYNRVCKFDTIEKYKNNEKLLSIIGLACVKKDSLYLLPHIINNLKHTSYGRKNAIYFTTIFMEKKLLYSYLFDGISISAFSFPMTDYVLSYIFKNIKNKTFTKEGNKIVIHDNGFTYKVYKNGDKMIIETYKDSKLIKRQWFR